MNPASPHFTTIDLAAVFNAQRIGLPSPLQTPAFMREKTGLAVFNGIPFTLGDAEGANAILLDDEPVTVDLGSVQATYVLFLHAVADRPTNYQDGFADFALDGNEMGDQVSDYVLEYDDDTIHETLILRRFAIQQSRIGWGASPFEAIAAEKAAVFNTVSEDALLGNMPRGPYGRGETRTHSGREGMAEKLWLYALANPHADRPIRRLLLKPCNEQSVIYAISLTTLHEHPLRPGVRRKLRLTLPDGAQPNAIDQYEHLAIDLGQVISARAALEYDRTHWLGVQPNIQPTVSQRDVIVEYEAHPQARLYVAVENQTDPIVYDLAALENGESAPALPLSGASQGTSMAVVQPAQRLVQVRVLQKGTNNLVPVRIHFHGAHGEYLPPRGRHRKVNPFWFEDNYGEFVNGRNQYSYIDGHCEVDLPLGDVYVEITKGYETAPVRTQVTIGPHTDELVFELERVLPWREKGWVTADTHVHFLSPSTALLEGQAEDVHVVNLLASQWGEMYSNVSDFDGKTTFGAREFGGDGEFLLRVGTENRMQVLGHISLLGYSGHMIHPLCTGGPSESALGDPQEVVMAEWAQRCIEQGGLVVMPHAPNPQLERAADIVLGVVHAIEMMTFNPYDAQINPYGLADWYRYLHLGYQVPVVGGSDKMAASSLLGGIRTYAHLGEREFTYENWMAAVRAGNTFVTVGPLAELRVEGVMPGGQVHLPAGGGTVDIEWRVESVSLPIQLVEVVQDGLVVDQVEVHDMQAAGGRQVSITSSSWIALRVRGSQIDCAFPRTGSEGATQDDEYGEIAAHTSAVQVLLAGSPLFSPQDAFTVLEQIEGTMAYVDTIAPRPQVQRFKEMRAVLETAHNRLHQRMHARGIFHKHTPLHEHQDDETGDVM